MTTRREFAQLSAIGAGLVSAPVWAKQSGKSVELDYFLLEQESLTHSQIALELGQWHNLAQQFREIKGSDLSKFWFEVQPLLSRRPIALAGLTAGYSAFVIAQLMQDYGYGFVGARHACSMSKAVAQRMGLLSILELNTAPAVSWIMAKTGRAFR